MKVEVDNATLLFQYIRNKDVLNAITRVKTYPEECEIWVVGRNYKTKSNSHYLARDYDPMKQLQDCEIAWKYLPLHLVCMLIQRHQRKRKNTYVDNHNFGQDVTYQQMKKLVSLLVSTYPKAIKSKDYHGNLPIHYIFQKQQNIHCDEALLNKLMDRKCSNLWATDSSGRNICEMICQSNARDDIYNSVNQYRGDNVDDWLQKLLLSSQQHYEDKRRYQHLPTVNSHSKQHCKKTKKRSSNLEMECMYKDEAIDTLSAQILALQAKLKQVKMDPPQQDMNNISHINTASLRRVEESSISLQSKYDMLKEQVINTNVITSNNCSGNNNNGNSNDNIETNLTFMEYKKTKSLHEVLKENEALLEKSKLDSTIVSNQHEQITNLTKKIKDLEQERDELKEKMKESLNQVDQFKADMQERHDSVAHLRQVIDLLQNEIEAKTEEMDILKSSLAESGRRSTMFEAKLQDQEDELHRKVTHMEKELKEQSEVITTLTKSLNESRLLNVSKSNLEQRNYKYTGLVFDSSKEHNNTDIKQMKSDHSAFTSSKQYLGESFSDDRKESSNDIVKTPVTFSDSDDYIILNTKDKTDNNDSHNNFYNMNRNIHKLHDTRRHSSLSSESSERRLIPKSESNKSGRMSSKEKHARIVQKQKQLRSDLREICNQIKSVLPAHLNVSDTKDFASTSNNNDETDDGHNKMGEEKLKLAERRKILEDARPWRNTRSDRSKSPPRTDNLLSSSRSSLCKATASELGELILGFS